MLRLRWAFKDTRLVLMVWAMRLSLLIQRSRHSAGATRPTLVNRSILDLEGLGSRPANRTTFPFRESVGVLIERLGENFRACACRTPAKEVNTSGLSKCRGNPEVLTSRVSKSTRL